MGRNFYCGSNIAGQCSQIHSKISEKGRLRAGLLPVLLIALMVGGFNQIPAISGFHGRRERMALCRIGLFAGASAARPDLFVDARPRRRRTGWETFGVTHEIKPLSDERPGAPIPLT